MAREGHTARPVQQRPRAQAVRASRRPPGMLIRTSLALWAKISPVQDSRVLWLRPGLCPLPFCRWWGAGGAKAPDVGGGSVQEARPLLLPLRRAGGGAALPVS